MQILDKLNKQNISDACIYLIADTFFAKRYGHRAVVLETHRMICWYFAF